MSTTITIRKDPLLKPIIQWINMLFTIRNVSSDLTLISTPSSIPVYLYPSPTKLLNPKLHNTSIVTPRSNSGNTVSSIWNSYTPDYSEWNYPMVEHNMPVTNLAVFCFYLIKRCMVYSVITKQQCPSPSLSTLPHGMA